VRQWSDTQQAVRDSYARHFAAWSNDHVRHDQQGEFRPEHWKSVGASGLLSLPFDTEWGGAGHDLLTTMYVLEALGYGCRDNGLNFCVSTQIVSAGIPIQRFGSTYLKERYLPGICDGTLIGAHAITERHGGSDAAAMKTTATAQGDTFVLNGEKCFISSAPMADVFVVYARTDAGNSPFGITALVVDRDTPGLHVGSSIEKMGLRTSPFANVTFTDCVVPKRNVIGSVGSGFVVLDYVMKWEILCNFIIHAGTMRNRLDRTVEFARSRVQFGSPVGSHQLVSSKIVSMKIGLDTSRMWLYETAEKFASGADVMLELAIAKLLSSEANLNSALDAVQIFGARGYTAEWGLEKDLRDAVGGTIYSGTSEVQRSKIARLIGLK